jgi:GH24 family phage-related lysozyme (muramidase)
MIEPILKEQLERDEGRQLKAYRDSVGVWTIGVGHLLGSSPRMSWITNEECDALLRADVEEAITSLSNVFGVVELQRLNAPRMRAMVNMMFNRGEGHVRRSTTITPAIKHALGIMATQSSNTEVWKAVSDAILASPWAAQIKSRGNRLAKQFETGQDQ